MIPNDQLERLMTREQLIESIDCIVEDHTAFHLIEGKDDLIARLCDSVCDHMPVTITRN